MMKDRELELNSPRVSFFMLRWRALIVTTVIPIENLPVPLKHYGVFNVLPIRKVFA